MSEELKLVQNDNGEWELYKDTYDITIHCESEEEQEKVLNMLKGIQWIPTTERLPENGMDVIACFSNGTMTELRYTGNGIFSGIYNHTTKVVIAWMPLPEPYKGE